MAEPKDDTQHVDGGRRSGKTRGAVDGDMLRARLAQVLWLLCVVAALFLAVGALTYALKANADNSLVTFVRDGANFVDLGFFSIENGIKEFTGENAEIKNALFNWGLGAVFWLVVGRLLDRLVRP